MTDPLKLADQLAYEGGTLVLHTEDDVGETIHRRISVPAELAAAALRLAEAIEEPWRPSAGLSWTCIICGSSCVWDGESEFRGNHAPGCAWAAYRAELEEA